MHINKIYTEASYQESLTTKGKFAQIIKLKLLKIKQYIAISASKFYSIYCMSIVWNNFIRGALVFRASICQSLFHQHKSQAFPLSKFPDKQYNDAPIEDFTDYPILLINTNN